jgi:hypothetical protein
MKNNLVATVLIVVLALTGLWAAFLVLQYNRYSNRANALQARVNEINNNRNITQALANDAIAYSQQQPALLPLLQQFGLVGGASAPASAPAPQPKAAPAPAPKAAPKTSTSKK